MAMARRSSWPLALAGSFFVTMSAPMVAPGSVHAGDVAFGEYLSGECVTCHRRTGEATGIPSITGWPQDAFIAVLKSYRSKERDHQLMQTLAARLSDEEIEALAAYFESLGMPGETK